MTTATHPAPTLADVAKAAGVSASTASRALNGHSTVQRERAARIVAAADQLGYVPDVHARALVCGSTPTMVVIVSPSVDRVALGEFLGGLVVAAEDQGLTVLVSACPGPRAQLTRIVRRLRAQRPHTVLLLGEPEAADLRLIQAEVTPGRQVTVIPASMLSGPQAPAAALQAALDSDHRRHPDKVSPITIEEREIP